MTDCNYNLRPIWDELLEIYAAIKRVLDVYGLRHFVIGGTALGAVRHKGFIPWDDDFDIMMPRQDYIKFQSVAPKCLPNYLKFISAHNNPDYVYAFGKVMETRQDVVDAISGQSNLSLFQGLYVDVIPIDGIPSNKFAIFCWLVKRAILRRLSKSYKRRLKYEAWISSRAFDCSVKVEDTKESGRRLLKYQGWDSAIFRHPVWLPFENIQVPLPSPPEKFLINMFGPDYMQLPPEDRRVPSHQLIVTKWKLDVTNLS